jgi:hypothetical protein
MADFCLDAQRDGFVMTGQACCFSRQAPRFCAN